MATINFFFVDPETFEDFPAGSVTIQDGEITSDNPDLVDLAYGSGSSFNEIIKTLSDWSNGYLRSELDRSKSALSTGTIQLRTLHDNYLG